VLAGNFNLNILIIINIKDKIRRAINVKRGKDIGIYGAGT
jgi:hypothetical protein